MTLRYGDPYWLARVPKRRLPGYPRHRGHLSVDVAIVGGGLTGCLTAYAFAMAGVEVGLFERDRLAHGGTARGSGLLLLDPDVEFLDLSGAYGLRVARVMWQVSRRAALDLAATLRRLRVRCELSQEGAIRLARTPEAAAGLHREYRARRAAGLEVTWLPRSAVMRETNVGAAGAMRTRGDGRLDPLRACLGVAAAAARRGARFHERSPVRRVRPGRDAVEIVTEGGTVQADRVVIATGLPTRDYQPLSRHFESVETYLALTERLSAPVRREVGRRTAILTDTDTPSHALQWRPDHRVLFVGADQPETPVRRRDKVLVQRTGQLMYELSLLYPAISGVQPEYGWEAGFGQTGDGLPYIGPHRNYPRHLFALGHGRHGLGMAFLASRMLLRHYQGRPAKGDDLFAFGRS